MFESADILSLFSAISSSVCVAIGAIGPAIGIGFVGSQALDAMARKKEAHSAVFNTMVISIALTGTVGIYSLFISILIYFS